MSYLSCKQLLSTAAALAVMTAGSAYGQTAPWTNGGGDNDWNNTANWTDGFLPEALAGNAEGEAQINLFGEDRAIISADPTLVPGHLRVGVNGLKGELEITGGSTNFDKTINNRIGAGNGGDGIVNQSGGFVNLGHLTVLGLDGNSSGTWTQTGGQLRVGREAGGVSLEVGRNGTGAYAVSGDSIFDTRAGVALASAGAGAGTIDVNGSSVTFDVGSWASIDGSWNQGALGTLRTGLDAGGFNPIFIDEVDGDALAGGNGDVTFASGAVLDPYDAGGAPSNVWTTVMTWEGTLADNGLVLSTDAMNAGWSMQFDGNMLQVMLGGATLVGDTDGDGDIDDFDLLNAISNFTGSLAAGTGGRGIPEGDTDADADVDDFDLLNMISGFTGSLSAPAVPEPASLALLGLGGLLLARRRRSA